MCGSWKAVSMKEATPTGRVEQAHKRVRALVDGQVVADTMRPVLVWEIPYFPAYYVPAADIRAELIDTGTTKSARLGGVTVPAAAQTFPDSPVEELRDLVRLDWSAMSEWLEEDEPVYVHPRDPYARVDILASSRQVRVELDGVTVAESSQPRILFETGLPPRYYLPLTDVRMDMLRPSDSNTQC